MHEDTTERTGPIEPDAGAADAGASAPDGSAPSSASVEEFERLAVLRMGGGDVEGAIDELPEEQARDVAEVAIDRVVRGYDHL